LPAAAQGVAFQASSLPQQARFEGLTETMGAVVIQATNAGTVKAGSSITVAYSGTITNVTAANAAGTIGGKLGATIYSPSGTPFPGVTVTASGNNLTLSFTADTAFAAGDYIVISQVRVNVNALGAGTTTVTATLSGTSSAPISNPITFTQATVPVASVINPSTSVAITAAPAQLQTCALLAQTFTVSVTERYPAALTSSATEIAFTPNTNPAATGTQVQVVVTGVPAGLSVTPGVPTNPAGSTVNFTAVPAAQTSTGGALTFTYTVANGTDQNGLAETVNIPFTIAGAAGATSIPPIGTSAAVTAAVNLAPVTTATTTTIRFAPNNQGGGTVASVGDCVTNLLFPFITNQVGFDTSIEISNTTADDLAFGAGAGAAAQSGSCTLTFYPTDLTTQTSTAAGTLGTASQVTTPTIPAGGAYNVLQSATSFKLQSGYMFAVCRFLNGHGFSFVLNGTPTSATISQGLLALVIPNPIGARNGFVPAILTPIGGLVAGAPVPGTGRAAGSGEALAH